MSRVPPDEVSLSIPVPLRLLATRPEGSGPFPVVLALHGYGMTAEGMHELLPRLVPDGFLMVSVQGPFSALLPEPGERKEPERGFHWGVSPRPEENRAVHKEAVSAAISWAAVHDGEPGRVSLIGFSQPCSFNYRLALHPPHGLPFRALVGLCGGIPGEWNDTEPLSTEASSAAAALHVSTSGDPYYPPEKIATFRQRLAARFGTVEHVVLAGGHRIPSAAIPLVRELLEARG